ncbi:alpha/beta hydrolase family protein [Actinomyces minihominis]|uniref:alpha/beta hydrolase family protein n=1 Tax=Actinomyces minihominis TaxID=2002838 RepID=UPI000C087EA8|nr:prolyl oligopeptidase family serine peptidase [Actinomyces minihominis]
MAKETAAYGTWTSPVTPESFTERTVVITQLRLDGPDIYWVEDNPRREGRSVLLRRDAMGQTMEVLPLLEGSRLINVSTDVHGRGGRAYAVRDGQLVFSDGNDNRVYAFRVSDRRRAVVPLTPLSDSVYGDFELDLSRGLVYAVREDRSGEAEGREPVSTLVSIPIDGSAARNPDLIRTIFEGTDFVSSPGLSHDNSKLVWITWNHPEMPWTQSQLHVGALSEFGDYLSDVVLVDHKDVCVYEPRWTLDNDLIHADDSTGWANLYRTEGFELREGEPSDAWQTRLRTRALHPANQAFSQPHWKLGSHTYDNLDNDHLVCTWAKDGTRHLGTIRLDNGLLEEWPLGWWPVGNVASDSGRVIFLGDSAIEPPSIIEVKNGEPVVVRPSTEVEVHPGFISRVENVKWKNDDNTRGHGLLFMPTNQNFKAPETELPPLLVSVNPMPTMAAHPGIDMAVEFWTSRGFAVLKPNPRGATGFGRNYRSQISGHWGTRDVADIVSGVKHLIAEGLVDAGRIAIRGESFGVVTVLHAIEKTDLFSGAVALAGTPDIRDLAANAHKFEKNYPGRLVGSYNLEDAAWAEANALEHIEQVNAPVLFMHGGKDHLAPVERVEKAVETLKQEGKPVALVVFEEEGHSYAQDRSIRTAWDTELAFYGEIWGFQTTSDIKVEIANWNR